VDSLKRKHRSEKMITVIPSYNFDASEKTITLGSRYADLTIGQILEIKNLTKQIDIYTSKNPRKRRLRRNEAGMDISVADGVITFIETATMEDTDRIQITADVEENMLSSPEYPFGASGTLIAASGTLTKPDTGFINTDGASIIWLTGKYAGDSESITVIVHGYADEDDNADPIAAMTLDSSMKHAKIQVPTGLPYITIEVTNNSLVAPVIFTAVLNMVR
jgi:hypothetical protein